MRIDAYNQINQIYGVGRTNKSGKTGYTSGVSSTDQVSVSSIGKDMHIAKTALQNVPDIREDRVAELKAKIQSGNYNVSNESFAEKLLSTYEQYAI